MDVYMKLLTIFRLISELQSTQEGYAPLQLTKGWHVNGSQIVGTEKSIKI